jgi:hypothetical protein
MISSRLKRVLLQSQMVLYLSATAMVVEETMILTPTTS